MTLEKSYNPHEIEKAIYAQWETEKCLSPSDQGTPYCIMLPPPNVTGSLHMGHGFQTSLMDALIRYHRMSGNNTLWQGGVDHAGIATQMVVERQLSLEGQSRHALGREKFIERVWQWKHESGDTITQQQRRMGASIDWSRSCFTLDENISHAVRKVFVSLYQEGLIYRGKRLVNWDPTLHTAVSDLEVIHEERNGHLWYIRYPITDSSDFIVIATTRPETLLGDTAVAVNPSDERYQHLVGKMIALPLTDRTIPIVADHDVDKTFGTGCVKITPAHDFNDYAVGKRLQLPLINILTFDAHLNENVPEKYQGLDRFKAREIIIQDLESLGLLVKTENYRVKIPLGDRSNDILEPWLTDQWFMKMEPLAKPAMEAVQSGKIKFIPETWSKTYFQWMMNIQDWCISRQLWWGHRIPAWYDEQGRSYVGLSEAEVRQTYQLDPALSLTQDEDVLDTWFSSALWPFVTLGWPEASKPLKTFYPTSVLVTGFDIIFFWVARMIMLGLKFMDDVPFHEIYITGLIRDIEGQKMSKSKGNVLDPIDLIDGIDLPSLMAKRTHGLMQPSLKDKIEKATRKQFPVGIPAHGTDALRMTFCSLASTGRDIRFDLGRLEGYRNFCNKLWNASRFVLMNVPEPMLGAWPAVSELHPINQWILSSLNQTIESARGYFALYRFDLLVQTLYDFTWREFCDWYLELAKTLLNDPSAPQHKHSTQKTLIHVLETLLRLLHPIIPFVTECLWQSVAPMNGIHEKTIMLQPYPTVMPEFTNKTVEKEIKKVKDLILCVRNARSEMNISPSKKIPCLIRFAHKKDRLHFNTYQTFIQNLTKVDRTSILEKNDVPPQSISAVSGKTELFLPMEGLIDLNAEMNRLEKEMARLESDRLKTSSKLQNENFTANAPKDIVKKEQDRLTEIDESLQKVQQHIERLRSISAK